MACEKRAGKADFSTSDRLGVHWDWVADGAEMVGDLAGDRWRQRDAALFVRQLLLAADAIRQPNAIVPAISGGEPVDP
jgi:hypothetical protein